MTSRQAVLVAIPYLPSVSWFVKLRSNDAVAWHTAEITDKQRPRNRCAIATAQGTQMLSVPLQGGRNQKEPLCQRKPAEGNKWQREHINAIQTAYGNAPFFIHFADALFERLSHQHENLASMNLSLIELLLDWFRYEVNVQTPDEAVHMDDNVLVEVRYPQVFEHKTGFQPGCSAIDLLFNCGPESVVYLNRALR